MDNFFLNTPGGARMKTIDLTGNRYGRLTALKKVGKRPNGNALWECRCTCGNTCVVDAYNLKTGVTRSCGCLRRAQSKQNCAKNEAFRSHIGNTASLGIVNGTNVLAMTKRRQTNRSGVIGVSYEKGREVWVARLYVKGHLVLNSIFKDRSEAVRARKRAEAQYLKPVLASLDRPWNGDSSCN